MFRYQISLVLNIVVLIINRQFRTYNTGNPSFGCIHYSSVDDIKQGAESSMVRQKFKDKLKVKNATSQLNSTHLNVWWLPNLNGDGEFLGLKIFVWPADRLFRQRDGAGIFDLQSLLTHRSPDVPRLEGPSLVPAHDDRQTESRQARNGLERNDENVGWPADPSF